MRFVIDDEDIARAVVAAALAWDRDAAEPTSALEFARYLTGVEWQPRPSGRPRGAGDRDPATSSGRRSEAALRRHARDRATG